MLLMDHFTNIKLYVKIICISIWSVNSPILKGYFVIFQILKLFIFFKKSVVCFQGKVQETCSQSKEELTSEVTSWHLRRIFLFVHTYFWLYNTLILTWNFCFYIFVVYFHPLQLIMENICCFILCIPLS